MKAAKHVAHLKLLLTAGLLIVFAAGCNNRAAISNGGDPPSTSSIGKQAPLADCASMPGGDGGPEAGCGPADSTPPTVSLSNVHSNSVLHSGSLIGTASDDGNQAFVTVQLDGGAFEPAIVSGGTWKFMLPVPTAAGWRQYSQHTVIVRAEDDAGNETLTAPVTFRMGVNNDVNGDGYEDVAASDTNVNKAYLYLGGSAGLVTTPSTTITGTGTAFTCNPLFGVSLALGDIDGDGFADLVVGADFQCLSANHSDEGAIFVFYGGPTGIASSNDTQAGTIITGTTPVELLGTAVAVADIDGDGCGDLITVKGNSASGAVHSALLVFKGNPTGIASQNDTAPATKVDAGVFPIFKNLTVGDFNGDHFADVAVTDAPGSTVYVFQSAGTAGITATTTSVGAGGPNAVLSGAPSFGSSLGAGDVNGDGFDDLVSGTGRFLTAGTAYVFLSKGTTGLTATGVTSRTTSQADTTISGTVGNGGLGGTLAVGDINGDGFADVVVGSPGTSTSTPLGAYIFLGSGTGIASAVNDTDASAILTSSTTAQGDFGISAVLHDFNGDGYADLMVGSPFPSSGNGNAYVFHSSGALGIPGSTVAPTVANTKITGPGSNRFGVILR